ncbi:MAG: YdeI/OmpD-associated family protein [Bacteroidota bacterium]
MIQKYESEQLIKQLEKRKGGYFYLRIDAEVVNQFEKKRATRLICTIDDKVSYRCGLNHLGDGHFFIILASKYLQQLHKKFGDKIHYLIEVDPNPLGVEVPEVLTVLLQQDEAAKVQFDQLTDGKKRSLIHTINRVKNIDKQVQMILDFLQAQQSLKRR